VDRVLRGGGAALLVAGGGGALWQDDSASDDAVTAVSNNSPPPDYATCVAADLERLRCRRRFSRHLSPPTADLDINENLQANGTSGLAPKLLPVSLTPAHVAATGPSALQLYKVAPANGAETGDSRTSASGCQQQPETAFDSSTWPRRQGSGSLLSFAAVDVEDEATRSSTAACKRLHHPDGASNPQLTEEVSRTDVTAADCCTLSTFLNIVDVDPSSSVLPTAIPTSYPVTASCHQCRPGDKTDLIKCRTSCHLAMESVETLSPSQSPSCMRTMAHEDAINVSNLLASGSNENRSRHGGDAVQSTSSRTGPSTRQKAGKAASPKRSKSPSSSGLSLLWCIHPRCGKSKSAAEGAGAGTGVGRPLDAGQLAGDGVVTDSDRGSSLSECPPPASALDLARRLCNGDDDDEASSDYWSARASADQLPCPSCASNMPHTATSTTAGRGCCSTTADSSLLTWRRNVDDSDMVGKS